MFPPQSHQNRLKFALKRSDRAVTLPRLQGGHTAPRRRQRLAAMGPYKESYILYCGANFERCPRSQKACALSTRGAAGKYTLTAQHNAPVALHLRMRLGRRVIFSELTARSDRCCCTDTFASVVRLIWRTPCNSCHLGFCSGNSEHTGPGLSRLVPNG